MELIKNQQLKISECLSHLKDRFIEKYELTEYIDNTRETLFFGLYNIHEIQFLQSHKGTKNIMFGGTDIDLIKSNQKLLNKLAKIKINKIYALSQNIIMRLSELGFVSEYFNLNLVDTRLFKPVSNFGSKIYIYNGLTSDNEELYGKNIYEELILTYPEIEFIKSNSLRLKYEDMPKIYSECFLGLRLTTNDGNANMVQEMVSMNIPVIHNGEQGGIPWKTIDDIKISLANIIFKYNINI